MKSALFAAFVFLAACATGCTGSATTPSQTPPFTKVDILVGTGGVAASGNTLTVNYTGWLYDPTRSGTKGLQFDTASGFSFVLGTGQVIAGWDQGLAGMNAGGLRRLTIPPSLAYGDSRSGKIPPNATLVFDITLVSVQ